MDTDTVKPEVPESLVTDGIILDLASTRWTASLQNELSSNVMSDFGVTGHQVNNVCKCELFPTNAWPNSPDHQEDVQQNISIPAMKQEFIDISPKKEKTEDDKPIKYIKLADAENCPQLGTVRTDTQPVVIKTKMTGAHEDFEGPMISGKLGINEEICKVKIENGLIEPTVRDESDLVATGPYEENVCKCEQQEDIKQDTLITAVKPEMMDIFIKKEETDVVFKEEINDNQIIKEEIQDCKEYIKLEDGMNYPRVDNLTETVNSESQSDVMENEVSQEDGLQQERNNGDSDHEVLRLRSSKRVHESRILQGAVTVASFNVENDFGESHFFSCGEESDHKEDGNKGSKSKHQLHRNKRQRKIISMDAAEYLPQKGDTWHGNKNKSGRDTHKRSHSTDRPHQCEVCEKNFKTAITLRNHLRLHSDQIKYSHQGGKPFSCADCGDSFSRLGNLKIHQLLHTGKKLFACEVCDKSYAQPVGLRYHMITHREVKPFSCADCGKSFSRLSVLKTHQLLHTGKKLFACKACDKSFAQPAVLHSHMKTHQAVKPFSCADCGKSFSRSDSLKEHQFLHTGKKLLACEICDKSFAAPKGLRYHMKTHQAVKPFSCTDCEKSFSKLCILKTHQLVHTGKKLFACEVCDKSYAQPGGLRYHMITHQAVKPFSCTDCGKSFTMLSSLKTHQLVHSGKKLFSCTDCGKSFSRLSSLKMHQLIHTGKKLYTCEICDKSFAQPPGLHSHMKTHQEVKPFSCTDCGKSYSQSFHLKRHQLIHTGKKLFACEVCNKSFTQPDGLRSHMKIHKK